MGTQFVTVDGVTVAYRVQNGADGVTLLQIPGSVSHMGMENHHPAFARHYERLTRFCRLIRYDKRGTGLSDRNVAPPPVAVDVQDVEAILDATDTDTVAICALAGGAASGLMFSVTHPERVSHLILVGPLCCSLINPYAAADEDNLLDSEIILKLIRTDFAGFTDFLGFNMLPDGTAEEQELYRDYLRAIANPSAYAGLWEALSKMDVRDSVPKVSVPTLIIHAARDQGAPPYHSYYLEEHIPGAVRVELDTSAHVPWLDERMGPRVAAEIETFLTGGAAHSIDRVLASVLFTDIVESSRQQQAFGDAAWQQLIASFQEATTRGVERFGGRVVKYQGDGAMASFPVPGDALRAARALVADAKNLGINIRAGLHTGEAYESKGDLFGTCVNVAARVSSEAGAGEVLTTDIVRGLLEGTDFRFTDVGERDLKGVGPRRLVRLA